MNIPLFLILVICLGGVSFWLSKNSQSKTAGDFFLMGRKLGLFGLTMALLSTQIGGGALLGASEEAYHRGWGVIFYPLGMVLGLIILGLGYGSKMRKLNLTTVPEIFEKIYKSTRLRQIASLLSILSLFLILIGQGIAARKFFGSLGFHGDVLFVLFWILLIAYTARGGLAAAVKTDILQTSFIILTLVVALFSISYFSEISSPEVLLTHSTTHESSTPWLSWLLLPLLFMLIEQDMGQWCFAAKTPRTVSKASLTAAFILMGTSLIPIFFGIKAASQGIVVEEGSSVLISAVQKLTNPTLATFVVCAVLMAIISTANALLCSVSSNIICDFPKFSQSVTVSRSITVLVGVSTLLLSFAFKNVVSVLMFSYEFAVCVLFVPITMAVWMKTPPQKRSALLSMSVGAISFILLKIWHFSIPKEVISLSLSLGSFVLSEKIYQSQHKDSSHVIH